MRTQHEVIGYSTAELVTLMLDSGIHTSLDKFKRLAIELQRRALVNSALKEEKEAINEVAD